MASDGVSVVQPSLCYDPEAAEAAVGNPAEMRIAMLHDGASDVARAHGGRLMLVCARRGAWLCFLELLDLGYRPVGEDRRECDRLMALGMAGGLPESVRARVRAHGWPTGPAALEARQEEEAAELAEFAATHRADVVHRRLQTGPRVRVHDALDAAVRARNLDAAQVLLVAGAVLQVRTVLWAALKPDHRALRWALQANEHVCTMPVLGEALRLGVGHESAVMIRERIEFFKQRRQDINSIRVRKRLEQRQDEMRRMMESEVRVAAAQRDSSWTAELTQLLTRAYHDYAVAAAASASAAAAAAVADAAAAEAAYAVNHPCDAGAGAGAGAVAASGAGRGGSPSRKRSRSPEPEEDPEMRE
jgi:hypothetical protein